MKNTARAKKAKTGVFGCKKETCKYFAKTNAKKKSDDALVKLNRILANEI